MLRSFVVTLTLVSLVSFVLGVQPTPAATGQDALAGKVLRLQGTALAVQDALPRVLKAGDPVYIGDVLSTGKDALLEIKMIDDGLFTLAERTVFVVIDYTFNNGGKASMRLMSGALKAVSGRLAKLDTQPFRLATEVATIGIRGTTFWAGDMPDGSLHVGLWSEGHVVVENKAGRSDITKRGDGVNLNSVDTPPSDPHHWPDKMNDMARKMVSFSR